MPLRRALPLILVAGLLLRLVLFLHLKDGLLLQRPFLDAGFYHRWAAEIAAGDWAGSTRGVFTMSPGYPYFLAVVYLLFGVGTGAAVLVQLLLGVGCGWMIYRLGRRHLAPEAALLAAGFYLFYAPELFYESTLLKASLINVLNTGALLAASTAHPAAWLLSGVLTACSAHCRPTALLLVPVAALWLWRTSGRRVLAVALYSAGVVLALLPVAARNQQVGGAWVWTTAHGGMNLYSGNSPESRGPYEPLSFARTDPDFEQEDFLREARRRAGRELTPAQASRFWYAEAWRFVRREPAREAVLLLKKAAIFFNDYEAPINLDYSVFRRELGSVLTLPLLSFGVLLSLAAVGMARAAPNLLLLGYLGAILVSNVVFLVSSEYRFPVVPVLCLYAGQGVWAVVRDVRARSAKRLLPAAAVLLAVLGFSFFDSYGLLLNLPGYKRGMEAKAWYNLGLVYQDAGRDREAVAAYEEALRRAPGDPETEDNLGSVLAHQGRLGEALVHFERAAVVFPENLARARAELRRRQEAEGRATGK